MPEVIHFRDSDKIIKEKGLEPDVSITLEYVEACSTATGRHKLHIEPEQLAANRFDAVGMCFLDNDLLHRTGIKVN